MSFKDQIKKYKKELKDAHEEEQVRKPPSMYGSVFEKELPVNKWRCDDGDHEIDVIPFIGGPNHPHRAGKITFSVDYFVHKNIGPGNEHFVCPKTYEEPCPVCEYLSANYPVGPDLYSKIKAQERSTYLVWVHDSDEEEKKGIQIWDVARWFFGDYLKKLGAGTRRGGGVTTWSEIDKTGKSVAWTVQSEGEGKVRYFAHRFIDRTEDIPDWILDQVTFHLDDYIKLKSNYDEIKEAFYGQSPQLQMAETLKPADISIDCPEGGELGKDWKQFDNCSDCPLWDDCQDEHEKLEKEPEPDDKPSKQRASRERPSRRRRR